MSRDHPINKAMKLPSVRAYLTQIFALSPVAKVKCRKMAVQYDGEGKGEMFSNSLDRACKTWAQEFGNRMITPDMARRHERVFLQTLDNELGIQAED